MSNRDKQVELIRELNSKTCQCGGTKNTHMSFCRKCYSSLPKDLKKRLYCRIGDGYEEAHSEAMSILRPKSDV